MPVLWDKQRATIVSNESADILRMLNSGFVPLADEAVDLYPVHMRDAIDALNARIYPSLNNGVYRTGFATTQAAYEEAFADVFAMLEELEQRLSDGRDFLFGAALTEADIRLFVTLVRFDPAYHGLFRANLRRLADYPQLSGYLRDLYQRPGIAGTVNLDHIKRGYYSIKALNPTGIVPLGPELAWAAYARPKTITRLDGLHAGFGRVRHADDGLTNLRCLSMVTLSLPSKPS
mgnify:CR=1 FL=1